MVLLIEQYYFYINYLNHLLKLNLVETNLNHEIKVNF